mgnify:CR=1 FL=1|jgi:Prohead core protein protease.
MDKKVKLITESNLDNFEIITESGDESRPATIKMRGVYLASDVKNGNSRIYPYEELKETVDKFIREKINTKTALEELEHSSEISINPDRVCARTLELVEDNKSWIGTSVVLASDEKFGIKGTKCGDILKSLLQYDVACGHSSRGVGNVNEHTGVVEDYQLICIDTVLNPSIGIFNKSNANRFVNGILESKNFIVNTHGEILEETFNSFEKGISKMPNTRITEKKVDFLAKEVMKFFESFRNS